MSNYSTDVHNFFLKNLTIEDWRALKTGEPVYWSLKTQRICLISSLSGKNLLLNSAGMLIGKYY